MLSKKVCKACWIRKGCVWRDLDDRKWAQKIVACPLQPGRHIAKNENFVTISWISTEREVPKRCPYALEHLMDKDV